MERMILNTDKGFHLPNRHDFVHALWSSPKIEVKEIEIFIEKTNAKFK